MVSVASPGPGIFLRGKPFPSESASVNRVERNATCKVQEPGARRSVGHVCPTRCSCSAPNPVPFCVGAESSSALNFCGTATAVKPT